MPSLFWLQTVTTFLRRRQSRPLKTRPTRYRNAASGPGVSPRLGSVSGRAGRVGPARAGRLKGQAGGGVGVAGDREGVDRP